MALIASGEVYRGHVIVRRPYGKSRMIWEATCPYVADGALGFSITAAWTKAEMRANIDAHVTGHFRLCSRDYNGVLPQCPGGDGTVLRVARPTRTCDLCGKPHDEAGSVHRACALEEARWDDRLGDREC
jgi:hypothetical protein